VKYEGFFASIKVHKQTLRTILGAAVFLVLAVGWSVDASAAERPNIVFILTDDMGYSDPACYGGKFVPTPNIDRLANEGIRFTHFYDDAPICSASRCSFITGMFPARWNFTTYLDNRAQNRDCEQADFLTTNAPALARVMNSCTAVCSSTSLASMRLSAGTLSGDTR